MAYQSAKATKNPGDRLRRAFLSADDVLEFMIAGARAVQDRHRHLHQPPPPCRRFLADLQVRLEEMGVSDINEIVGTVLDGEQEAGVVFMEAAP